MSAVHEVVDQKQVAEMLQGCLKMAFPTMSSVQRQEILCGLTCALSCAAGQWSGLTLEEVNRFQVALWDVVEVHTRKPNRN